MSGYALSLERSALMANSLRICLRSYLSGVFQKYFFKKSKLFLVSMSNQSTLNAKFSFVLIELDGFAATESRLGTAEVTLLD
jgi:hypothetical protein